MKKILVLLFTVLCVLTPIKVFAYDDTNLLDDSAQLLSSSQRDSLEYKMETVSDRLGVNVVIVTTNGTNGKNIGVYVDDYYDEHFSNPDGIILVIDMDSRSWYVSTTGNCIDNISDYEIDYIVEDYMLGYLGEGDFYNAFNSFIDGFDYYFYYDDTAEIEEQYGKSEPSFGAMNFGISGIIGAISSFVTGLVLKSQLKSTAPQRTATNYSNGFAVTGVSDYYLGTHVSKSRIIKNNNRGSSISSGSYGSGHSSHTSHSGASHGGHGGHF